MTSGQIRKTLYILLVFVCTGCIAGLSGSLRIPEDARIIKQVPLYEDTGYQCGPSSLAAVMNYWAGKGHLLAEVSPAAIRSEIYSEGARGVLGMDMEFYARKHGFRTRQYSGSINDLRDNVNKEIPPIILVDHGSSFYQKNHFMVVTGYSGDGIIVQSGIEKKHIRFDVLEAIWQKTHHWTLVLQPLD